MNIIFSRHDFERPFGTSFELRQKGIYAGVVHYGQSRTNRGLTYNWAWGSNNDGATSFFVDSESVLHEYSGALVASSPEEACTFALLAQSTPEEPTDYNDYDDDTEEV